MSCFERGKTPEPVPGRVLSHTGTKIHPDTVEEVEGRMLAIKIPNKTQHRRGSKHVWTVSEKEPGARRFPSTQGCTKSLVFQMGCIRSCLPLGRVSLGLLL